MAAPHTPDAPRLVDQIHHERYPIKIYEYKNKRFWVLWDLKDQHCFRPERFTSKDALKTLALALIKEREQGLKVVTDLLAGLAIREYSFQANRQTPRQEPERKVSEVNEPTRRVPL